MATDGKATIVLSAIDRTKQAFDSAKKNLDGLRSAGDGLALKFGSIGVAIGAAFQAVSFKHIIDAADNISKLTQRTGIAAESLTALKYAGELSDVSIDELADGLKKLAVNMSAAAGGSKEQQAAFSAIGVSVKTASGQLRSTDEVLGDLADKFAGFSDGPEKAALAVALFGRSGDRLIPFLNSGRKGLADMRDEAQKLGVVFGDKLAKEAEAFNDNLTRIKAGLEGVKVGILGGLLPALNTLLLELIEGRKAYGSFSAALIDQGLRAPLFQSYGAGAKAARDELALLNDQLDRLKNNKPQAVVEGAGGAGFVGPRVGNRRSADAERQLNEDKARAEKRLAYFKAMQAAEALALGQGVVDERRFQGPRKKGAPVIDTEAAANAAALLRKQLDGRLQALRDGLANEADLFEHTNAKLAEAFAHGELSIAEFYDAKQSSQAAFLVKQQEAFDAEIKEWEAYRAKLAKPQEQADVDNLITKALTEQSKATREAGQAAEVAGMQRTRASESFQRSLQDIDAQLKDLSGDAYAAALLRNAQRVADAKMQLAKGGGDPKRIADLTQLLKLQADQVHLQEQLALLDERQAVAEEAYIVIARARGAGLVEQEQGIQAIRQKGVTQLQGMAEQVAELARVSGNAQLYLWADQLALALTKAQAQVNPTLERVRAAADEMGEALGSATEQAIMDFENLDDVVMNLARDLERIVLRTLVTEPLTESLKGMLQKFAPAVASMASGGAAAPASSAAAAAASGAAGQAASTAALNLLATGAGNAGAAVGSFGTVAMPAATSAMFELATAAKIASFALSKVGGSGVANSIGSSLGSGAGSGAGSSVNGSAGTPSIAQYAHSGGIVGEGGNYRPVPAGLFDGAMGYRSGGIAGLAPDEVPAILHRGEEVLRQGDPRHRDNGGGAPSKLINVNVNVTAMQGMSNKTAMQQGAAAGRAVRAALARND